ncbi:hypothetical protein AB4Y45_33570 [Paraburkholderia sp. EG287A]|uniref:hypothetical protein n=1 Tax=Paraburkholderia sp. EG287A TaxID=3237012 RepID=UPI0034D37645
MTKHIIIAETTPKSPRQYLASSKQGGRLTKEITDVALFASEAAAAAAVRDLLQTDFERRNGVTLLLGTVGFIVETTKAVARKAVASGFVIRRNTGRYYKGPKTKPPRDFHDAHYAYIENRDAATVFPTEAIALKTGEDCRAILLQAAEDDRNSRYPGTYQQLHDEFAFTVEAV